MFWFQLYCGISGEEFIDQVYLVLFSVLFTSVPPLALGVFDRDFSHLELTSIPLLLEDSPPCTPASPSGLP